MDNFYLSAIVEEINRQIGGLAVGRVRVRGSDLVLDWRTHASLPLVASLDPTSPAVYLGRRALKTLEGGPTPFLLLLRKRLRNARISSIVKDPGDRLVRIIFESRDAGGQILKLFLVLALTGRSSNAYLLNSEGVVESMLARRGGLEPGDRITFQQENLDLSKFEESLSESDGVEEIIEKYFGVSSLLGPRFRKEFIARSAFRSPPEAFRSILRDLDNAESEPSVYSRIPLEEAGTKPLDSRKELILSHISLVSAQGLLRYQFDSLSEAAEQYQESLRSSRSFERELNELSRRLSSELRRRTAARAALEADLLGYEEPEKLKRYGDLLLANLSQATVDGSKVSMVDYYHPDQSVITLDIGDAPSLQEAATRFFNRYRKARRAINAISSRKKSIDSDISVLDRLLKSLEESPAADTLVRARSEAATIAGLRLSPVTQERTAKRMARRGWAIAGRRFLSTDGYEILVGRNNIENDRITFRIAQPKDVWLHAADYPGSHVVIRNPARLDLPQQSIIEGAELAAFYSQARKESKAAVHYTQKRFVSKPPKAKPGLVRLSSFKTLLVEPRCRAERIVE